MDKVTFSWGDVDDFVTIKMDLYFNRETVRVFLFLDPSPLL